jgi:hypothetical protein
VHFYYNNEEGNRNPGAYQVCSYYGAWHHVIQDKETGEPRLGEPAPEVHAYNCKDKTKSSLDSSKDPEPDPIDHKIRHSPVEISPQLAISSMSATRMAPMVTVTPARAASPAPVAGSTPVAIQGKFNAALWWTGPPSSGGLMGPGGPGGPGGPRMPGAGPGQANVPQQPVLPAGDMKTMGALPQVFTGNWAWADDFIKEVKGYLQLNQDVARFDSPIKKIAFTLTLIKGADTAGWTCDMGAMLDGLNPADNIPELWTQFLEEFGQQFQDTQKEDWVRNQLENLQMKFPEVDAYITKFEELARQAGYTMGNPKTVHTFVKGLMQSVIEEVFKPPHMTTYQEIKQKATVLSCEYCWTTYYMHGTKETPFEGFSRGTCKGNCSSTDKMGKAEGIRACQGSITHWTYHHGWITNWSQWTWVIVRHPLIEAHPEDE